MSERVKDPDEDGWNYGRRPKPGTDARKLVTLLQDGMVWIGIRAYASQYDHWMNNGEPERATVLAWQDLPQPAQHRWSHGMLI